MSIKFYPDMQKTLQRGDLHPKRKAIFEFIYTRRNKVTEIIAALFILLFVYTAVNKFFAFNTLKFVLKDYPLIGWMPATVAWALPITELIISVFLFIPVTRKIGLYSSMILMTAFSLYTAYMLVFEPKMPCTCGGMLQELSWPQHLVFNVFFVVLAFIGVRLMKREF